MKYYNVILDDGRSERVVADDYQTVDKEILFFANGEPVSDVFFRASSVVGVTVISDNYETYVRPGDDIAGGETV